MQLQRISAFSDGKIGGNPAGVMLCEKLPEVEVMQTTAKEVGYSETVFSAPQTQEDGRIVWRTRYFSPESEVPFCGHATIALGAALAQAHGDGIYDLLLNNAQITVEGQQKGGVTSAALQSPSTNSNLLAQADINDSLALFGYHADQLDERLPPAFIHAGANHFMLALKDRSALSAMRYDLEKGRQFMASRNLVTIMLVYCEEENLFHTRNAFASGGVLEDPATGAATAAFCGYLRDINWPHGGSIDIVQGEDMGMRSRIQATFTSDAGSSIRVSGTTRPLD